MHFILQEHGEYMMQLRAYEEGSAAPQEMVVRHCTYLQVLIRCFHSERFAAVTYPTL